MAEECRAPVYSLSKERVGEVTLPAVLFDAPARNHLLYEVVKMQLANRRSGTAATKTRAFVSGGGKKPWRQKGTGRARQGSIRATQWVGGATVFGPQPRDYSYRLPASARREALRTALSIKQKEGRLLVVERLEVPNGKTKELAKILATLGAENALLVAAAREENLWRAARNLARAKVLSVAGVNVADLLRYQTLVITVDALEQLRERVAA